jgi:UDP-N-acetylmuramate--alanine ligase
MNARAHRFSRTQALWKEFAHSFAQADQVYVLDIYPAGEKPIEGVNASLITEELVKRQPSSRHFSFQDANALRAHLQPQDVVLTLGAGDVWKWGESLVRVLQSES